MKLNPAANRSFAYGHRGLRVILAALVLFLSSAVFPGCDDDAGINPLLLSIALTPTNPSIAAGSSQQFKATGTYANATTKDLTKTAKWASSDVNIATISNAKGALGKATSLSPGKTTISATVSGVKGTTVLTVTTAKLQTIEVTPTNSTVAKGSNQQFKATGIYTDSTKQDLTDTVTWTSSTTKVAIISDATGSKGLAKAVDPGTTTITATSGSISGSTLLTVTAAVLQSIGVTPTNPSIAKGTTLQFKATGTYSDSSTQDITNSVTWDSSKTAVATISTKAGTMGLSTAVDAGQTTITATLGAVSGSTTLTVTAAVLVSIGITPSNPTIAKGTTLQFKATGTYSDSTTQDLTATATWASSAKAVGSISNAAGSQGLATGISAGTTAITATSGTISNSTTLTVTAATLKAITVTPANPSIAKGTTQQFTATGTYSDSSTQDLTTSVTWDSTVKGVATISNAAGTEGLSSGVGVGQTTISATLGTVSGSTTLTVTAASLLSIAVNPANPTIAKGTAQQFTATGTYSDSTTQDLTTTVTWASSAQVVATISNATGSNGLATGVSAGNTTISATLGTVSGSTTLTVTAANLVSINVTPANPSIAKGTTQQFKATGTYSDSSTQDLTTTVTWDSGTKTVATISNAAGTEGLSSGVGVGQSTITATLGSVSGSTTLTVTAANLLSIAVTPVLPSIAKGSTLQFKATGTYSDTTTQDLTFAVTWDSSAKAVATISNAVASAGLASAVSAGNTTITATLGAISGSTTLTVTAATLVSIAVTPASPSIAKGTTLQFTAIGTYSDSSTQDITTSVTWASGTKTVGTISNAAGSEGLAAAVGVGQTTIRATLSGISGTSTLNVTAASLLSIAVTPANPTIAKGTTQQFKATGTYSDTTTQDLTISVTWASSAKGVASVSNAAASKGLATGVSAGNTTITATLGTVSGSTTLTVTAATLVSIAVTPATPSIAKGTAQQFAATGTYSDSSTQVLTTSVTWDSSTKTVATISNAAGSEGLSSGAGVGQTTISATLGTVSGSTTLTVTPAVLTTINITPVNPTIAQGTTQQFTAMGVYTDNSSQNLTTTATWASSITAVASISNASGSQGLATSVSPGTTTISATLGSVTGTTTLTVTAATLVSIAVTPATPSVSKGYTQQFVAMGTYSDSSTQNLTTSVTWDSGTTTVATISNAAGSEGLASALGAGSTTISATLGTVTGSTTLTVTSATLLSIAVTPVTPSASKGTTVQFTATGTYSDSTTQNLTTNVVWATSIPAVATISNASGSQGRATAATTGTTTISATLGTISGSTTLTVTAPTLVSIDITPASPTITQGTTIQLTATGTYTDSSTQNITTTVTWDSSNKGVGTVSNTAGSQGLASALTVGSTTISAIMAGVTGTTTLTVTNALLVSIAVTPATASINVGATQQYTAMGTYSDSSTQNLTTSVTWHSGNGAAATISNTAGSNGRATGVGAGTSTITAVLSGITGAATLTVTPAVSPVTVNFPSVGDTRYTRYGIQIYFWYAGDYVQGTRTTTLASTRSANIHLVITPNVLSSCGTQNVRMRINGVAVGTFAITRGVTLITRTFNFSAIAGPTYTLRYETISTVSSGCGSAGYSNTGSTVRLNP